MKALAETTGSFMLIDFATGQEIPFDRPAVITIGSFFSTRAAAGQVRVLGSVTDEATDDEFRSYLRDSEDVDLAVAAFLANYAVGAEKKAEEPKRAAKAKKAEA